MRGKFIVLDGADGAGKDTQANALLAAAQAQGLSAALIRFPGYDTTLSGREVKAYLAGEYGEFNAVHPKITSYLYAVDRYEQQPLLNELLEKHDLVIASRYVISNIAYQAARLPEAERPAYREWAKKLDYDVLKNPHEDAVLFLSLPVELSKTLIEKRLKQGTAGRDIYDENLTYQRTVLGEYEYLCSTHDHWYQINCAHDGKIRSIDDIAQEIQQLVFTKILALAETE